MLRDVCSEAPACAWCFQGGVQGAACARIANASPALSLCRHTTAKRLPRHCPLGMSMGIGRMKNIMCSRVTTEVPPRAPMRV